MSVCCECCVLAGRGLCDGLITRPEESYWLRCVAVCDLETSRMRKSWPALGRSATGQKKIASVLTSSTEKTSWVRDFRLPPRNSQELHSSGLLRSEYDSFLPTFRVNLSVPSSEFKNRNQNFLLTFRDNLSVPCSEFKNQFFDFRNSSNIWSFLSKCIFSDYKH